MEITLDTHAFIWYLDKNLNHKLSPKALKAIKEAEETDNIYIPIIVLMEILYLIEKGRVNLSFHKLLLNLEESINYEIVPFDNRLLKIAETIKGLEVHDRLILATAVLTDSPLVSSDKERYTLRELKLYGERQCHRKLGSMISPKRIMQTNRCKIFSSFSLVPGCWVERARNQHQPCVTIMKLLGFVP